MKRLFKLIPAVAFCYVISIGYVFGQGVINVQNGNINHYYKDFAIPGHGYSLLLERSYNSLSKFSGMFGNKWGSNFDMDFTQTPEGFVEITEFGGGFKTTFAPKGYAPEDLDSFINTLFKKLPASSKTTELKKDLKRDERLRRKLAREHKVKFPIAMETPLHANDRGPETLLKTKNKKWLRKAKVENSVWIRTFSDGKIEFFNSQGKLIRREDSNGNYLRLSYNKDGDLSKVADSSGRQVLITYHSNTSRVASVKNPLGKVCKYKYDGKGNLIYAKNAKGYQFYHKYDGRNRMTQVKYPKGEQENMKYDNQNRIAFHSGPEDIKTNYKYNTKGNPDKYFDVIVTRELGKKPNHVVTVDKYAYTFGKRPNGSRFTYKLVSVLDGVKTETVYTPCCGKPISIKQGNAVTRFEYYEDGNLKKKVHPSGEIVGLKYDKTFGKVSRVSRTDPKSKKTDSTEYKYDSKGNLSYASNKQQKIFVSLIYDTKGRIRRLIDQSGKKIEFSYNELGKPTKIKLVGVGSINVSYNASGEITDVKSTGGRKIATEVTAAFQVLLDVIRPAGVTLSL